MWRRKVFTRLSFISMPFKKGMQLLTEAINRLGPTIRTTILLRDIEEQSVKDTAQILGTSITAVKARVFQGRRKLRRNLNTGFLRGLYTVGQPEAQRC